MMSAIPQRSFTFTDFTREPDRVFRVVNPHDPAHTAEFAFSDNRWQLLDLLRPHDKKSHATITFHTVPRWLRGDVKIFIASRWLEDGEELGSLGRAVTALRLLGAALPDFESPPRVLGDAEALQVREYILDLRRSPESNSSYRMWINRFAEHLREREPGAARYFELELPSNSTKAESKPPLTVDEEKIVPTAVQAAILNATEEEENDYLEALRTYPDESGPYSEYHRAQQRERRRLRRAGIYVEQPRRVPLRQLQARAIKAQAVKLAICVGRRAAALCNLSFEVICEEGEVEGERGVWIRFREMKIRDVDEDVFCPGVYAALALDAIGKTREFTADLREQSPQHAGFLFLHPVGHRRTGASVLRPEQINGYMNGQKRGRNRSGTEGGWSPGLAERRGIRREGEIVKITTHNFRHTRATHLFRGGMELHEVSEDLGHASPDMTGKFYIAGTARQRERFEELMRAGALDAALMDMVNGRKLYERRLQPKHLEILRRQGRMAAPNLFGYCTLPVKAGPCPTGNRCYIGMNPKGGGCEYYMLSPDALPALHEDREMVLAQITALRADPERNRMWLSKFENQLRTLDELIERAERLRARLGHSGAGLEPGTFFLPADRLRTGPAVPAGRALVPAGGDPAEDEE